MWAEYPLGATRIRHYYERNPRTPQIREVLDAASEYYGLPTREIIAARNHAPVVRARHTAIYVAYKMTPSSLKMIGKVFGDRDHTTILSAVRKMMAAVDNGEAEVIDDVREILNIVQDRVNRRLAEFFK